VLLKAVVQAIPTYNMGVFQLPIALCKELNQLMQHFWWSHMSKKLKDTLDELVKNGEIQNKGRLGFWDLVIFNKALLAKQGWRIMKEPNSVAAKILISKYFPNSSFLEAQLGSKPSFAWRSLFNARELLSKGLLWRVGDGRSIKVWDEKWLPTPSTYSIRSIPRSLDENSMVADLIDQYTKRWNVELLHAEFTEEEAQTILGIPLNPLLPKDKLIWRGKMTGDFSMRSALYLGIELQEAEGGNVLIQEGS